MPVATKVAAFSLRSRVVRRRKRELATSCSSATCSTRESVLSTSITKRRYLLILERPARNQQADFAGESVPSISTCNLIPSAGSRGGKRHWEKRSSHVQDLQKAQIRRPRFPLQGRWAAGDR